MFCFIAGCARSAGDGPDIASEILSEVTRIRAILLRKSGCHYA
jgi:hypothetical protein